MSHQGMRPEEAFKTVIPQIEEFLKSIRLINEGVELRYRKQGNLYILKFFNKYYLSEERITQFKLEQLPGCCGVVVSTEAIVFERFRKKGLGSFMNGIRCQMAKLMGYGLIICTENVTNDAQTKILSNNAWVQGAHFVNPKTTNRIQVWTKELT